jgi:hypothetical protein
MESFNTETNPGPLIALLLVAQWLERWCAFLSAQIDPWRSCSESAITKGNPSAPPPFTVIVIEQAYSNLNICHHIDCLKAKKERMNDADT